MNPSQVPLSIMVPVLLLAFIVIALLAAMFTVGMMRAPIKYEVDRYLKRVGVGFDVEQTTEISMPMYGLRDPLPVDGTVKGHLVNGSLYEPLQTGHQPPSTPRRGDVARHRAQSVRDRLGRTVGERRSRQPES